MRLLYALTVLLLLPQAPSLEGIRPRARELGIEVGVLPPGRWNAITDVAGVRVGHATLIRGDDVRTGVTAVLPHGGNLFTDKVPAAVYVGNGFGKLMGSTQVRELGNLETPILLTATLNVPRVADALLDYMLALPGMEEVRSINPVVGETNDGYLNDIRRRAVGRDEVFAALSGAASGPVEEGSVGAGTGTVCFGFKGGIGTSSRKAQTGGAEYVVGVLVQSNFGGVLRIAGAPVGRELEREGIRGRDSHDGSCMIVVATDAPLDARNLERLAARAMLGLGVTGGYSSNGSGDYVIAFSTHPGLRIGGDGARLPAALLLPNEQTSPLFLAVKEATEEAIYNSLLRARDVTGYRGRQVRALPLEPLREILRRHGVSSTPDPGR